jgi:hypothetical protein
MGWSKNFGFSLHVITKPGFDKATHSTTTFIPERLCDKGWEARKSQSKVFAYHTLKNAPQNTNHKRFHTFFPRQAPASLWSKATFLIYIIVQNRQQNRQTRKLNGFPSIYPSLHPKFPPQNHSLPNIRALSLHHSLTKRSLTKNLQHTDFALHTLDFPLVFRTPIATPHSLLIFPTPENRKHEVEP